MAAPARLTPRTRSPAPAFASLNRLAPKGVGLDQLAAGPDIFLVGREDQLRVALVEQIQVAVEFYSLFIEIGTQSAVGQDRMFCPDSHVSENFGLS